MIHAMARTLLALTLALILAACSSRPLNIHTLMPPPGVADSEPAEVAIDVESVVVPPQVDRTELVVRQGRSALVILDSDWWGASLAEEIRSTLNARFAGAGNKASGSDGDRDAENQAIAARLTISRFDSVPGQHAWIEASYQLIRHHVQPRASLTCQTRLRTDAGEGIENLVNAHQENLQALANQMHQAASSLSQGNGQCP